MKKMHKVNVPSSVKNKEEKDLNSLKGKKFPVTYSQYGNRLNCDGNVALNQSNQFKHLDIINKISKTGSISVSMGNQGQQQPKNSLIKLHQPSSTTQSIQPKKLIQIPSNKILPIDLKSTPTLSGSKSSSITSFNSGVLSRPAFSKQMAANATQSLISMNNKKSLLKSKQIAQQLNVNTKVIEPSTILETSECNNSSADKLKNISPIIRPLKIGSCVNENIVRESTLQRPTQFSSNITISKAANNIHRKEEPPSVDLMPIQSKSTMQSSKSNMGNNLGNNLNVKQNINQNFISGSKVQLSNDNLINIKSQIIGKDESENEKVDNEDGKCDSQNGKANNKNESYILNPITGFFETVRNGNSVKNLLERSFFKSIIKNTIEQEFNGSTSSQMITKKLEGNHIQKFAKSDSSINKVVQENIVKKNELSPPNCKAVSSNQSSTNMKENIDSINPEIINKESESGHSVKTDLQHCSVQKPVSEGNDNSLCGPRTKVRAKSLSLRNRMRTEKRKSLSIAGAAKETLCEKINEKNQNCNQMASKLLCNEIIQISPDILRPLEYKKSVEVNLLTPTKSQSVSPEQPKSKSEVIDLESSESQNPTSSDDVQYVSDSESLHLEISKTVQNSVKSFLKNIGLQVSDNGIIRKSRLNLNVNKFGLISLNEKQTVNREIIGSSNYEKPIYYRENKSRNTAAYGNNLYYCKGCHCHGAPESFLSENFCSKECIDKKRNKKIQNSTDAYKATHTHIVKGENRQRKTSSLLATKINSIMADQKAQSNNVSLINKKSVFSWQTYLSFTKAESAGIDLFLNPFPCGPNLFEIGMKLEAIDPENNSSFCVCTVVEKKGFRLKLHFDSYSSIYDFWINADSMDIFPPGWCSKNQRILTPPKDYRTEDFNWTSYLINKKALSAPRQIFTHLNSSSNSNPFKIGMKFEVNDVGSTFKVRVASVVDVLDNRILIHFDGCDDKLNYWADCGSPYIYPVNWHLYSNYELVQPPNFTGIFVWKKYLEDTNAIAVTEEIVHTREPMGFKAGMKLEIVDRKNPSLIRPATVTMVDKYDIKILFDGWLPEYEFQIVDDNPDIHPIGWCELTGHELESPPGYEGLPKFMPCPMPGCRGIGNAKNIETDFHATLEECPYELTNWLKDIEKPDRIKQFNLKLSYADCQINNKRKSNELIEFGGKKILNTNELKPFLKCSTPKLISKRSISVKSLSLTESEYYSSPHSIPPKVEISDEIDQTPFFNPRIEAAKKLLMDYGPHLENTFHYWSNNITKIFITSASQDQIKLLEKNPLKWSTNDVFHFIKDIPQCNEIAELFRYNEIDGEALLSLREKDLVDILELKGGPSIKIYNCIVYLRGEVLERGKK